MKKGLLIDKEGCHYSFTIQEGTAGFNNIVKLFYSKLGQWTEICKGKLASKLECDGNGFNVTLGKKKFYLDYSEAAHMQQMLRLVDRDTRFNTFTPYKIVRKS